MLQADLGPYRFAVRRSASTVVAARIATELGGRTGSDHFRSDVPSIGKEALRDQTPVSVDVEDGAAQLFARDQTTQGGCCRRAARMVPFRSIEAPNTNSAGFALQRESVAIENLADPGFDAGSNVCLCERAREKKNC